MACKQSSSEKLAYPEVWRVAKRKNGSLDILRETANYVSLTSDRRPGRMTLLRATHSQRHKYLLPTKMYAFLNKLVSMVPAYLAF